MRAAGVFYLLCLGLGLAVTAQDCTVPTGRPNTLLVFDDRQKVTFADGSRATFECEVGYEPTGGARFITCTAGVWSSLTLECSRKQCGSPGEVENGYFDITGTEFGDKVVAICNTGFYIVGSNERTCGLQGWTGRVPYCEAVVCLLPHKVENASAPDPHKESYKYGEVIRYECLRGHTLNGSSSRSCSDEGNFRPDPPTCIKVQCKTPSIKNAYRDRGGAPPYGYNAFVTYQCDRGYTLVGEASVTCGINSQWSPALPECRVHTRPTIVPPDNGGPHWATSWWFITTRKTLS